jgi:hypothetical protein
MNPQELLIRQIRNIVGPQISLSNIFAQVLGISYDAAHRRVSKNAKFSLEEAIILCQHFDLSIDNLMPNNPFLAVKKAHKINKIDDFQAYFHGTKALLLPYQDSAYTMYYSAKDIPMHYSLAQPLLGKFKLYVWLNMATNYKDIHFKDFEVPVSVSQELHGLLGAFAQANITEIWNETTINSTLQQLYYFFEAGLISSNNALQIMKIIQHIVDQIKEKCEQQAPKFKLYHNELMQLSNTVLVHNETNASFFVPYNNMLGYFSTTDAQACSEELAFSLNQIKNSTAIHSANQKERLQFFSKIYQKIDIYTQKIEQY